MLQADSFLERNGTLFQILAAVVLAAVTSLVTWYFSHRNKATKTFDYRMEAIYDDMNRPTGLARFAPGRPARGAMFAARRRAGRSEPSTVEPVITEAEYYPG